MKEPVKSASGGGPWAVPYIAPGRQYADLRDEILGVVDQVFSNARFILRHDLFDFEAAIADFIGVAHVVGVNSGTDALMLSARAIGLGPRDEVVAPAHTFVSTIGAIVHAGAKPVLVDIGADFNLDAELVEAAISERTRAIMPVHLNGRVSDMKMINAIANRHGLKVIEDAAQALGAGQGNVRAGAFGHAGCFSLHPMKNLSVGGDGGFIATNDGDLADRLRVLGNIGQKTKTEIVEFGFNSRLDTLHAAVALVKLGKLPDWIERRREIAALYTDTLGGIGDMILPPRDGGGRRDVYSSYVVRTSRRDDLMAHLRNDAIEVFAHWNPPLHHHKALGLDTFRLPETERASLEVISLPIFPEMTNEEINLVIDSVRRFFQT